jgi:acylphosphatase
MASSQGITKTKQAPVAGAGVNGITYQGGPIIQTPGVYLIWYGNWSGNNATTILPLFVNGLNGSPYFDTNTTYYQSNPTTGATVVSRVGLNGQFFDSYSQGTALSDAAVQNVVANALNSHAFPLDTNGIYFVLTSADVTETSGFCSVYCGFHTRGTIDGADIKYAFVGNPDRCPASCEAQTVSPNGNSGADGMASVMAHELNETVTDPDLNAWFSGNTQGEVGDLCNFNFGQEFTAPNGSLFNVTLAGSRFLIQQNWLNLNGGGCAMKVGVPPPLNGAFVQQQYLDFLSHTADPNGFSSSVSALSSGMTRPTFTNNIMTSSEFANNGRFVAQAYRILGRDPDIAGYQLYDINMEAKGWTQTQVADAFITSTEFQQKFGANLDNTQFITVMYQNILLRQPDSGGLNGWVTNLNNGETRAQAAVAFLQSQEFLGNANTQNRITVFLLYYTMLRREPDSGGLTGNFNALQSGTSLTTLIGNFQSSAEYAARF